jgi:hypothetical protein
MYMFCKDLAYASRTYFQDKMRVLYQISLLGASKMFCQLFFLNYLTAPKQ